MYGVAPLPELAPAVDRLEASRGTRGCWNVQQRTTRRTALGVALAFACAGFAALAVMTSPSYGFARAERDGETDSAARASSERFALTNEPSAVSPSFALGSVDAADLLNRFGDALAEPQRERLAQLIDAARVMPDMTFAEFEALAERASAKDADAETRRTSSRAFFSRLDAKVTVADAVAKSIVELLRASSEPAEEEENATREIGDSALRIVKAMDAFRRFPEWSDADAATFERALEKTQIEKKTRSSLSNDRVPEPDAAVMRTRRVKPSWRPRSNPNASESRSSSDRRGGNHDALAAPLNGVRPPRGSASSKLETAPSLPFSSFASAPGVHAVQSLASSLGSSSSRAELERERASLAEPRVSDHAWGRGVRGDARATETLRGSFDPESVGLPRSFDSRLAFPACASVIGTVRDQGKCGSCWAVAVTEVMTDRLCVSTKGEEQRELSAEYPLACFDAGSGCDGGDVASAFRETTRRGVPFGGFEVSRAVSDHHSTRPANGSEKNTCVPYEFEPCEHPCQVAGATPKACPSSCEDGSALELVYPKSEAYACPGGDWACIAREIMTYGSVAVTFGSVRADFYDYASGVYRVADADDPGLGQHAAKLIGWGFEDGANDPYWIMMNSWQNWGDRGSGFVGVGEMNIENGIAAVRM